MSDSAVLLICKTLIALASIGAAVYTDESTWLVILVLLLLF